MRKSKRRIINNQKPIINKIIIAVFVFLAFVFLAFIFFKVLTLDSFVYVNRTEVGDVEIIGHDFRYIIPAETKIDSARGYGNYKLESLWKLSEKDEKRGGVISESLVKNYHLPIYLWKDGDNTNLSIYQRINAFFVQKRHRQEAVLFKSFNLPSSILINFVQEEITEESLKIEVEDLTGTQNIIENISRIVEISGSKISSNSKGYDAELDCEIISNDSKTAKIYASLLDCKNIVSKELEGTVKIRLGGKFALRF